MSRGTILLKIPFPAACEYNNAAAPETKRALKGVPVAKTGFSPVEIVPIFTSGA